MVFRLAVVGALLGIALGIVGVRSGALSRPVPVFHHLSHGCGHAASIDIAAAAFGVFRALAVPGEVLVPNGLAQRADHSAGLTAMVEAAVFSYRPPFGSDVGRGTKVVFTHVLDFFAETIKGESEAFGHVVGVVFSRGGIGEDRFHAVVAGHDDEAFTVTDVEDVVVNSIAVEGRTYQLELDVSVFLIDSGGA